MSRKVIVDADACPGKNIIIDVCHEAGVALILVASFAHEISAPAWVEVRKVDCYPQAVDILVSNLAAAQDVVITQDWGLAAICLAKGAVCLAPDGKKYDDSRMSAMLELRQRAPLKMINASKIVCAANWGCCPSFRMASEQSFDCKEGYWRF